MPTEARSPGSELTDQMRDAGPRTPCVPIILVLRMMWNTNEGFMLLKNERYHCVLYIFLVYLEGDLLFLFYTDDRKASQHLKVLQYQ